MHLGGLGKGLGRGDSGVLSRERVLWPIFFAFDQGMTEARWVERVGAHSQVTVVLLEVTNGMEVLQIHCFVLHLIR